jgi:hypothetical protein
VTVLLTGWDGGRLPVSSGGFACGVGCGSGDRFGRLERRGEVIIGNIIMKAGGCGCPVPGQE